MSEHHASLSWQRRSPDFSYESYNRSHSWSFQGGQTLQASASPEFLGEPEAVDPEEAYVAALASCHMLTFLAVAARKRFVVDSYEDDAVGVMQKNAAGQLVITRVQLRPRIVFSGEKRPSSEQLAKLHEQAHHGCFLANSVKTEVTVETT